jgi:cardiolipin synthase A/B
LQIGTIAAETAKSGEPVAGRAPGEELLELLPHGHEGFRKLIALIDAAEVDLRLLFYTFADDEIGIAVRDRLLAARERGVDVSLIVDDFGSFETPASFFAPLGEGGCKFCKFQPRLFQRYLLRNHQKMAIADGTRAIVGSFNVANSHMKEDQKDGWRDIGVYIEGPAAVRLARYFDAVEQWVHVKRSRMRRLYQLLAATNEREGPVRWIFGGPTRGYNNYVRQVREEFAKARSADLIMAYFAPTPRILAVVRRLAREGRFRMIAAAKTDVALSRAAAWHTYRTLLRAGAEIYEYRPRPLHSKLIIVDDVVFIGSGNFDVRSLYVNLEVMLRVERKDFVAKVRELFATELKDSDRIDLATLRAKRRWYKRLWWRTAYFLMVTVDRFLSRRFAS